MRRQDASLLLRWRSGTARIPILKERLFGLTNSEGNHGEDVKEYYFYLDSTPTHSYAKMLYKYPQAAFPYSNSVAENRRRSKTEFEYELMDTGIFDEDRYWDVFVEYAKSDAEDISIRITAVQPRARGGAASRPAPPLVPQHLVGGSTGAAARARRARPRQGARSSAAKHPALGHRYLYCDGPVELLFTDNETNRYRLWGQPNPTQYQKDGINDFVVQGRQNAVNPEKKGTKVCGPHGRSPSSPGRAPPFACASPTGRQLISPIRSAHFERTFDRSPARSRRVLRRRSPRRR